MKCIRCVSLEKCCSEKHIDCLSKIDVTLSCIYACLYMYYINDFDVCHNYICENYTIAKRSNIVENNAYVYKYKSKGNSNM